jgi:hypothetical protein
MAVCALSRASTTRCARSGHGGATIVRGARARNPAKRLARMSAASCGSKSPTAASRAAEVGTWSACHRATASRVSAAIDSSEPRVERP